MRVDVLKYHNDYYIHIEDVFLLGGEVVVEPEDLNDFHITTIDVEESAIVVLKKYGWNKVYKYIMLNHKNYL